MKIGYKLADRIRFSELKSGDTFIDPTDPDTFGPEIKIEYGDISYEFFNTEGDTTENCYASVALKTGNVFFYTKDFDVIPIKLKAVEE